MGLDTSCRFYKNTRTADSLLKPCYRHLAHKLPSTVSHQTFCGEITCTELFGVLGLCCTVPLVLPIILQGPKVFPNHTGCIQTPQAWGKHPQPATFQRATILCRYVQCRLTRRPFSKELKYGEGRFSLGATKRCALSMICSYAPWRLQDAPLSATWQRVGCGGKTAAAILLLRQEHKSWM